MGIGPACDGRRTRTPAGVGSQPIVLAAALLAAPLPLCWMGYLTALFAPAAWLLGRGSELRSSPRR